MKHPSGTMLAAALRDSASARLLAWYESAVKAREIVRAGAAELRACAVETGVRPQTLRRWAFAAARITRDDMEALANWSDSAGRTLSPWHVIELARAPRARRAHLLDGMLAGLWTVEKLRVELKENDAAAAGSGTMPAVDAARTARRAR